MCGKTLSVAMQLHRSVSTSTYQTRDRGLKALKRNIRLTKATLGNDILLGW